MIPATLILSTLVAGCHRAPANPPPSTSVDTAQSDTNTPAPTDPTGDHTADTGEAPSPEGCPPYEGLEPAIAITPPSRFGFSYPLASREDNKGIIATLVHKSLPEPYHEVLFPNVTVRVDDLPNGSYPLEELWDGVSTIPSDWTPSTFLQVSDQDGDGIEDYWIGEELVAGPLLGRDATNNRVIATFNGWDGGVFAADFDSDGDGYGDILQTGGAGDCAYIRYGPFDGYIPSALLEEAEPSSYTVLGSCIYDNLLPGAWILPDHYEGRDGIVFGVEGTIADSYAYVLEQPRGTRVPTRDAEATYSVATIEKTPNFADLGDVDGDGQRDYLFGNNDNLIAAKGPLRFDDYHQGHDWDPETPKRVIDVDPVRQWINDAIGDLNGDGVMELAAQQAIDRKTGVPHSGTTWPVIAFSPYDRQLDLSCAVPLSYKGIPLVSTRPIGESIADLDGDGLVDVVTQHQGTYDILIWWGRDIVAAHAALQP